jgi:MFS family permease
MTDIMGATPLQLVAWFSPMAAGGCVIATVGGFLLHLLPGSLLIGIAGVAWILAPLLFAIAPSEVNYWAYIFPSMICATIAIDITFNVTNIFISTNMPLKRQGLAGALINSILQLGIAVFLGFADLTATQTEKLGEKRSYKAVFWFEVACASVALILLLGFVKIDKAKSDLTMDEREAMMAEEVAVGR